MPAPPGLSLARRDSEGWGDEPSAGVPDEDPSRIASALIINEGFGRSEGDPRTCWSSYTADLQPLSRHEKKESIPRLGDGHGCGDT